VARSIGIIGHGVSAAIMYRRSLDRFDFNTVLLPYGYVLAQNPQYREDLDILVALCERRAVAVQTTKSIAYRPWGDSP
jgi:hypothetical protein